MQKRCRRNLAMQHVISRLQQDFKVTTQCWLVCLSVCLVCMFVGHVIIRKSEYPEYPEYPNHSQNLMGSKLDQVSSSNLFMKFHPMVLRNPVNKQTNKENNPS